MEVQRVKEFESCRLCLTEIWDRTITLLGGIIKDMLEIILPELNLSVSETPAICKKCLETLKQSYNFKSACLEAEDKVQDFVNPSLPSCVDLKQVLKKKHNINKIAENYVVCRMCLGLGHENSCTKLCSYDGDPLKNMVEKCLPEMGIDITKDPTICPVCLEQLEDQFHFIIQCLDTEEKVNYYCERKHISREIDLHSVYLFSMVDDNEDMDKQYDIVDNSDMKRENAGITVQTDSKVTDGSRQDNVKNAYDPVTFVDLTKDMLAAKTKNEFKREKKGTLPLEKMDVFPLEHAPLQKIDPPSEEVTFEVTKDGNGDDVITSHTSRIKTKEEDSSDVSVTSEDLLITTRFEEYDPSNLKKNKKVMKPKKPVAVQKATVDYKDDDVEDSDDSSHPKKRLVTRKCNQCNFKTKYTSRMKAHKTLNHSGRDADAPKNGHKPKLDKEPNSTIKCRACPYTTTDPSEYKSHKQNHKKEKEQKCHICGAVFVRSDFLKKHIENHGAQTIIANKPSKKPVPRIHSATATKSSRKHSFNFNGQFLKMFKCQLCPYQSRMRSNLLKHSLIHKKTTEIVKHKCKLCNFETIHKENFLAHTQSHDRDIENQVKKCFLCSFQPTTEKALKVHVNTVHKSNG